MEEIDKNRIDQFIIDGFNEYMRNRKRGSGLHVTSIAKGCPRYLYLEIIEGINEFDIKVDPESLKAVVGTMMHKIPLSEQHETSFYYTYKFNDRSIKIVGTYDELYIDENGGRWIMDKKFSPFINKRPPEHYINQVKLYAMLFRNELHKSESGITPENDIKGAILSYINTGYGKPKFKHFIIPLEEKDYEETNKWLESVVNPAIIGLSTYTTPERKEGWVCTICPFIDNCYTPEEKVNILKKYKREKKEMGVEIVGIEKLQ